MLLLLINWTSVGVKTAQFLLSFSILIALHEAGHFLSAKLFHCRVEKFFLFFDPWFCIWKKKVGETQYGIGWIPLGGYVKISGMIDESLDTKQMKQPAQPWEFRSKPSWQRLIIMAAGVIVNVILAIIIFICVMWKWGEQYLPPENLTYGLSVDSLGSKLGLRDGDVITRINDKDVKNVFKIPGQVIVDEASSITVKRNKNLTLDLFVPHDFIRSLNATRGERFVSVRMPFIVAGFAKGSTAATSGLRIGDRIVGVDSVNAIFFSDIRKLLKKHASSTVALKVLRASDTLNLPVKLNGKGEIGVMAESDYNKLGFKLMTRHYTFLESIPVGTALCWNNLVHYTTSLKQLFNGEANPNDSLGSIISIGNVFPGSWDWESFWMLTAFFSIILAFMNILPIPGLDGGHVLFTLVEMISGRKPSDKFMEYAQIVGMVILFALMAYAMGLDILRLFK